MANYFIGAATILYLLAAISFFLAKDWAKGMIFVGSVIINLGILAVK